MQVVYSRCAGLDVHQKTVSACVIVCEPDGKKRRQVRVGQICVHWPTSDYQFQIDTLRFYMSIVYM